MSVDQRTSALIVVDVQNDFCPGGPLAIDASDGIVPVVNRLMGRFSRVVATQDWHPKDHVSFASNHPGKAVFDTVAVGKTTQVLWPDHCVQATRGADFHPWLEVRRVGLVLRKGMRTELDSYSGFFENDGKTETGLQHWLSGLGLKRVYVCGLATDYCVRATALDARRLGFETFLVQDACRGVDQPPGGLDRALGEMRAAGVRFVQSGEVLS